ncbi:MAG: hypothetical protein R3B13_15990 [Polyangiaceae bacterium]
MGIDGIGKPPGGGIPPGGVPGVGQAAKTSKTFSVDAAQPVEGAQNESLARLSRGEITMDQYLDENVASAVAPLQDKLSADQLEFVRSTLREQMVSDPVLVDLVKQATGQAPKA